MILSHDLQRWEKKRNHAEEPMSLSDCYEAIDRLMEEMHYLNDLIRDCSSEEDYPLRLNVLRRIVELQDKELEELKLSRDEWKNNYENLLAYRRKK